MEIRLDRRFSDLSEDGKFNFRLFPFPLELFDMAN